jgi:hypothetical protein
VHDNIIKSAKDRVLTEVYTEKHHIIPKCLGGDNSKENLVSLLPKEHYIIHHLLTKIYPTNRKILYAFTMMLSENQNQKRFITSRMYAKINELKSQLNSGKNNPNFGCKTGGATGYKHTEETKEIIRLSKLGKKRAPFKRGSPSEETKKKMSESAKGKIPWNKGKKFILIGERERSR